MPGEEQGPRKVPNAKAPKTRPPKGLRDRLNLLHGELPTYSGPYSVGTMEMENAVDHPRTISNIKRHGIHLLRLETVLMTIYYPSAIGSGSGPSPSGDHRWSRVTWLPRPRVGSAKGYGKFAGIGDLAVPFFGLTTMFTKLPAFRNAKLATHWPPPESKRAGGPSQTKNNAGEPPPGEPEKPRFPVMLFSHGLGGSRSCYSSLCGEFASYGFIVVAVEHRDGSAPRTFVNHSKVSSAKSLNEHEKSAEAIEHLEEDLKRGYDVCDYIFPKNNPTDTAPNNDQGPDRELRDGQLDLRIAEVEEAFKVLKRIVQGDGMKVAEQNFRQKGYVGGSTAGLEGVDWDGWKDRVRLDHVTMAGHSFGGATTAEALRFSHRVPYVTQGLIFDIWGAVIKPIAELERHGAAQCIDRPILCINSEAFSYWQSNFNLVKSLCDEARTHGQPAWLMTVRGTVHVSQSDFSLLYPHICSVALKMTADPRRAIDINVNASLEFLKLVTPDKMCEIDRTFKGEGILAQEVLDPQEIPHDKLRQPDQEWIAARLKIEHEFAYRFDPRAMRKRRQLRKWHRGYPGLSGLDDPRDEVWMHFAPADEELEKYGTHMLEDDQTNAEFQSGESDISAAVASNAEGQLSKQSQHKDPEGREWKAKKGTFSRHRLGVVKDELRGPPAESRGSNEPDPSSVTPTKSRLVATRTEPFRHTEYMRRPRTLMKAKTRFGTATSLASYPGGA